MALCQHVLSSLKRVVMQLIVLNCYSAFLAVCVTQLPAFFKSLLNKTLLAFALSFVYIASFLFLAFDFSASIVMLFFHFLGQTRVYLSLYADVFTELWLRFASINQLSYLNPSLGLTDSSEATICLSAFESVGKPTVVDQFLKFVVFVTQM